MTAERFWKAIAAPKEINGSCLAVVLREDAAIGALGGSEVIPGDGRFSDYLLPTELVGIPPRQSGPVMGGLPKPQPQRKGVGGSGKGVRSKNRDNAPRGMSATR